jgi:c-di-AMP phosphodiesterase-like protein
VIHRWQSAAQNTNKVEASEVTHLLLVVSDAAQLLNGNGLLAIVDYEKRLAIRNVALARTGGRSKRNG